MGGGGLCYMYWCMAPVFSPLFIIPRMPSPLMFDLLHCTLKYSILFRIQMSWICFIALTDLCIWSTLQYHVSVAEYNVCAMEVHLTLTRNVICIMHFLTQKINCWVKQLYLHKKYSRSLITLKLNHWCQMDYFNNVWALNVSVVLLSV